MSCFGINSAKIRNGEGQKEKPVPPANSKESSKDKINFINENFNGKKLIYRVRKSRGKLSHP